MLTQSLGTILTPRSRHKDEVRAGGVKKNAVPRKDWVLVRNSGSRNKDGGSPGSVFCMLETFSPDSQIQQWLGVGSHVQYVKHVMYAQRKETN